MYSKLLKLVLLVVILVAVIQLIPVDRSNPAISANISSPEKIAAVLRRSCYDCHSNETVWPWYSRIAPVSWLVAHDVQEGREQLNFSRWGEYSEQKTNKLKQKIWEVIDEGEMPPLIYLPAHTEARLSDRDKRDIRLWLGY